MKKLIIALLVVSVFLSGCLANTATEVLEFDNDIENVRQHTISFATGGGDFEKFSEEIKEFNGKLDKIRSKDEKVNAFIEAQRKANDLRLEAFRDMDYDKINESTGYQARALEIYYDIKDAN